MLDCFAIRLVNPVEGVLQIAQDDRARAYSRDGLVWQIQVMAENPRDTWRGVPAIESASRYFNFGLWDPGDGMQQVPANPVLNIGMMSDTANKLTAALGNRLDELPFPLTDRFECWWLDHDDLPVALLASTEDARLTADLPIQRWQACRAAQTTFRSPTLDQVGISNSDQNDNRIHARRLEQQVAQRCRRHAWFQRRDDGSGTLLDHAATVLQHDTFPALTLSDAWPDTIAAGLVRDYLAWIAPQLLTHQHLSADQRRRLEQQAFVQPEHLARYYRLIPDIIDHEGMQRARVAARLQQSTK